MKIISLKFLSFFCLLSSTLIISSCSLFDQGENKRNNSTDLIAPGELGASCSSNSECGQGYICSNGVCVTDPVIGAECENNSDCGSSILYTCNDGVCEKNVAQEAQAEARPEIHQSMLLGVGAICASDAQCSTGMLCQYSFTSLNDFLSQSYKLNTSGYKTCKKINGQSCSVTNITDTSYPYYTIQSISSECVSGFCDTDKKCGLKTSRICSDYETYFTSQYRMCRSNIPCIGGGYNMCE